MELQIKEETFAGKVLDEILIEVQKERLTVAELIQCKVEKEVENYNIRIIQENQGFRNNIEETLNAKNPQNTAIQHKLADIESEVYRAWEAFKNNQVFVMVNNRQVENLEEELLLNQESQVSFIQLTPLAGG